MNSVIYEDNHIIVVYKKPNIPVCKDESKDMDLLNMIKTYLKIKYNKPGNVYLGMVHRLDRPVSGIMVFAKTSKAASRLSEQVKNHTFKKTYNAVVIGKPNSKETFIDKLLKDSKTNIVKVNQNGKEAVLDYELVDTKDNLSLVSINLKTGRSHQIRVQFSYHNYPLYGDNKYNKYAFTGEQIALLSKKIEFIHPVTKENMSFEIDLPNKYPWNIFNINKFKN